MENDGKVANVEFENLNFIGTINGQTNILYMWVYSHNSEFIFFEEPTAARGNSRPKVHQN